MPDHREAIEAWAKGRFSGADPRTVEAWARSRFAQPVTMGPNLETRIRELEERVKILEEAAGYDERLRLPSG